MSATKKDRERCPAHPKARMNDFGGAYILCAVCSMPILKSSELMRGWSKEPK